MSVHEEIAKLPLLAAGPALVAALAALGPRPRREVGLSGVREVLPDASEQVIVAQQWQRAISWQEACLNDAVLDVAGACAGVSEDDWGREEVSAGLSWSATAATDRLEVARALGGRCVLTGHLLRAGAITYRHAAELVHALEPLDDDTAADVEAKLLDGAGELTPAQLARKARKAVAKADPAGADARHKKARKGRRVEFTPLPDAMAELRAILPADLAAQVRADIDRYAGRRSGDDTRTLDQRRADALVALAALGAFTAAGFATSAGPGAAWDGEVGAATGGGACAATGGRVGPASGGRAGNVSRRGAGSGPRRGAGNPSGSGPCSAPGRGPGSDPGSGVGAATAGDAPSAAKTAEIVARLLAGKRATPARIALTAPLSTVLGAGNAPGELTGYGPVPATVVRELAADSRWEKWITGAGGVVTDLGTSVYRPPAALAALVRATYPTCVFPGCSQPSHRCDLDHNVRRVDGGPTSAANLVALCRRHHRAKDEAGWQLQHDHTTGVCTWTSPAGHTYTVTPPDQTDEPDPGSVPDDWTVPLRPESIPATASVGTTAWAGHTASAATVAEDPPPF